MKLFTRLVAVLVFITLPVAAQAELFLFSYTFDGNARGTGGNELSGVVQGSLLGDGDTILIHNFLSASLAGFPYEFSKYIGIRAADPDDQPVMSLSGAALDFWVCPLGFSEVDRDGAPDCPFGAEGGFLLSQFTTTVGDNAAWAGIPELGAGYRDGDRPLNLANWSAEAVSEVRVQFSYTFENNVRGSGGNELVGEVEGFLLADHDTVEITGLRSASLGAYDYVLNKGFVGIRAADPSAPARLSLSGNILDFWICPLGFSGINQGGGDCSFGAEGGFLISQEATPVGSNVAWAGIAQLGASYRDGDRPYNVGNWSTAITKVLKAKAPKKLKKPKKQK